jgi:predicted acetyltransferase
MKLRPLSMEDRIEALKGHSELAKENWEYLLGYVESMSWSDYLDALKKESLGQELKEGRVPATFLIAEDQGNLVGRASIRHELNDFLFNFGGHIGYGVRPNFRRQGFATEILKQSIKYLDEFGVKNILITCGNDNVGSRKVIEAQGGILENAVEYKGSSVLRFWISKH